MQKICRIAVAVSISLASASLFALPKDAEETTLPVLSPETQHATSSKRISNQFTRAHYKPVKVNDELSAQIFDRYIQQLDYNRNVFLASDIESLKKYRLEFDTIVSRGKLDAAYEIFNLNILLDMLNKKKEYYEAKFAKELKQIYKDIKDSIWKIIVSIAKELKSLESLNYYA